MIKLIECPRDAMQGIKEYIPWKKKASYINKLLQVGFDTIDFGSFVSPKAIPQMRDTARVVSLLRLDNTRTKLLAIVANLRGAQDAVQFEEVSCLGFPFSISETFQIRNTNSTLDEAMRRVSDIQSLCIKSNKVLVVYLSMGFGNPYGDPWNVEIVDYWARRLKELGITILQLSDTIGVSNKDSISYLFSYLVPALPEMEFGAHLHTTLDTWKEKVEAAYQHGCRRFDGAIKGFGGCPMAKDELTGNMPTEYMIDYLNEQGEDLKLDKDAFEQALQHASRIFPIS